MNILILGSGGREHALAWAVKQNPKCDRLIVAPGNAGTAGIAWNAGIDINDGDAVAEFAAENGVDFVIIGPEAPLVAGVADRLRDAGLSVFGPSGAAAQLEASKSFTKEICAAVDAPTAAYARFTDLDRVRLPGRLHVPQTLLGRIVDCGWLRADRRRKQPNYQHPSKNGSQHDSSPHCPKRKRNCSATSAR